MESEVLESLLAFTLALVVPIAMAVFSLRYPPSWKDKGPLAPFWSKINLLSLAGSAVIALITFFLYRDFVIEYRFIATFSAAIMTFVFGQTLFTDFAQRLADRRLFLIANLSSAIAGFLFIREFDPLNMPVYIIYAIIAMIFITVPFMGDSDGRAITLIVLSTFPVLGTTGAVGMFLGIVGVLATVLLYATGYAIKHRSFKVAFISKLSVPAVPLMLLPYLILIIANSFLYNK